MGNRLDKLLVDLIEAISSAVFIQKNLKLPYIQIAIRKLDTIKIFLMILWETKSLDNKKYVALSAPVDEVGKMLGGWNGKLIKENSTN